MPQIYMFDDNPVSVEMQRLRECTERSRRPWTLQLVSYKMEDGDHYTDPGPVVAQCGNGLAAGSVLILDAASPIKRKTFWADVVLALAEAYGNAAVRASHVVIHSAYPLEQIKKALADYAQKKALNQVFGTYTIEPVATETARKMIGQTVQYENERLATVVPYVPKTGDGSPLGKLVGALTA